MPKKLVVINDLHPSELAGAATIAHEFAVRASLLIPTEYWYSSSKKMLKIPEENLETRIFQLDIDHLEKKQSKFLSKLWREFFNLKSLVWFYLNLRRASPDIVWIHQIGNRFPRSIILTCWVLGIKPYVTAHDFGLVLPRKLFPRDLGFIDNFRQLSLISATKITCSLPTERLKFKIFLFLRLKTQLYIYNNFTHLICISSMQSTILSGIGFKVDSIIENGLDKCKCKYSGAKEPRTMLFAGRSYGKGLANLLESIRISNWHLYLAGGAELATIANEVLPKEKFTYLGSLTRRGVYEAIHRVSCVSVISECFDVFPTILIESLRHNTIAIASESVGNSNLLSMIESKLIIPYNQIPNLTELELTLVDLYNRNPENEFDNEVSTVEDSLQFYLSKFNLID